MPRRCRQCCRTALPNIVSPSTFCNDLLHVFTTSGIRAKVAGLDHGADDIEEDVVMVVLEGRRASGGAEWSEARSRSIARDGTRC
jgi:hypothetical protein